MLYISKIKTITYNMIIGVIFIAKNKLSVHQANDFTKLKSKNTQGTNA